MAEPITLEELQARLAELGERRLASGVARVAVGVALDAEARAKLNATSTLRVRTGRLRASISGSTRQESGGVSVVLRAGGRTPEGQVPYAATHEFGATIRPKRARMLRIPLPPALTAAGVDRFPTPLRSTGAGQFYRVGSLLFNVADRQPWYVLKASVTIPARPFLRPALDKAAERVPATARAMFREEVLRA